MSFQAFHALISAYCRATRSALISRHIFKTENMDIRNNLKKARKEHKMTQDEMAERLGMTRQAYCNMENGKTELINKKLYRIADMFGLSVESLMLGYSSVGDVADLTKKLDKSVQEITNLVTLVEEMQKALFYQKEHIRTLKQIQDYVFGKDSETMLRDIMSRNPDTGKTEK